MCIFNILVFYTGDAVVRAFAPHGGTSCLLLQPKDVRMRFIGESKLSVGVKLSVDCCCVASLCMVLRELA